MSMVISICMLFFLLIIFGVMRWSFNWPGKESETMTLIIVLVFSLLPVAFVLIDAIIERGGVIKYGEISIDFSKIHHLEPTSVTIPSNIGVRGQPVSDSYTSSILDSLREARSSEIIVVDLENGDAWWETRLLVLLAGAVRLAKPKIVVFVGTDAGVEQSFLGWGYSKDLLTCLLPTDYQYQISYYAALAAGKQWSMVEPIGNNATPMQPVSIQTRLATQHPWMAFNDTTGLPNEYLTEQLLASDLGTEIEMKGNVKNLSSMRMEEIFRPVLFKGSLDELNSNENQIKSFFKDDSAYIAITRNGKYKMLLSRWTGLNAIVKSFVGMDQEKVG
ncbi:MAG: hypothetical protein ABR936_02420 [Bacteroidota bacterium]